MPNHLRGASRNDGRRSSTPRAGVNPMQVFQSMSTAKMAGLISSARKRVAVVSPAIWQKTAEAIIAAAGRLAPDQITVIVDCDEEVCRLGYGDVTALPCLRDSGIQ